MRLLIRVDGGAQPNPGHGAAAAVAYNMDDMAKAVASESLYLGSDTSNNVAEHSAIFLALRMARALQAKEVNIESDSTLAVNHFNKKWQVQGKKLRPLVEQEWALAKRIGRVNLKWVPRDEVTEAHYMVQEVLEGKKDIPITKATTGKDLVFNDVEEFLRRKGIPVTNRTGFAIWVPNAAIIPFPYYHELEDGVHPSVDQSWWGDVVRCGAVYNTLLAWRPYGTSSMARTAEDLGVRRSWRAYRNNHDGGVELLMGFPEQFKLGDQIVRGGMKIVGYNGSHVSTLDGGPWFSAREFAWFTHEG